MKELTADLQLWHEFKVIPLIHFTVTQYSKIRRRIHNRRFNMRKVIKYLIPLIPVLVICGPTFMVIGYNPLTHMWASIGALMTGLGNAILFIKMMDQSKQIEEILRQREEKK